MSLSFLIARTRRGSPTYSARSLHTTSSSCTTGGDPIFQPFTIKHITLKNRILSTSHAPNYVEQAKPKERYQLYHEEKVKGGIAMTMFGGSSNVDVDSPSAFGQINVGNDEIIPYFKEFASRIHNYGVPLMCQLTHMGRRTFWHVEHWLPPVAPSCVREPMHRAFPKIIEDHDIARIVKAFGKAAKRCQIGDLDGCEVISGDHLIHQFMSPAINKRTDKYGGSLENRMRFPLEVLEEVRKQVGKQYIVGFRLTVDELIEGGITSEEGVEMCKILAQSGLVDYLNLNRGTVASYSHLSVQLPGMGYPSAPHLNYLHQVRKAVKVPLFHASRIDIPTARYALKEGLVDMVGMTRAHIADPYLIEKIKSGQENRIRQCVGASYCIDRIYEGGDALCVQNAATGREKTIPHKIQKSNQSPKKVVVVGAGPGGMEAARVLAERGHSVVVFEATGHVGGQIRLASKLSWRKPLIGISDWLANELTHLGVHIQFNTYAEVDNILAERPDLVIVATGGVPNLDFFPGSEHACSTWDVLGGAVEGSGNGQKETVLVFDDNGKYPGPCAAEYLARGGAKVEFVTPDRSLGVEIGATTFPVFLKNLYDLQVKISPDLRIHSATRTSDGRILVQLINEYNHQIEERLVDRLVVEHGTLPAEDLYYNLKPLSRNLGEVDMDGLINATGSLPPQPSNPQGSFDLLRIGDAVASRNIHAAIYDAIRQCKNF